MLCKILCLHVLIFAALLINGLTAKAVVELLLIGIKLHRSSNSQFWILGFDVKSCNWCEAALPARINFIKVSTLLLLFYTDLFLYLTIKIF